LLVRRRPFRRVAGMWGKNTREQRWAELVRGRIVVVDVETTGFDARGADRVVAVALQCVDEGQMAYPWASLVNPERAMAGTEVHGLTDAAVERAPTFGQIAQVVQQMVAGAVAVAAHNASFDVAFLSAELERAGLAFPSILVLDTMAIHHRLFPDGGPGGRRPASSRLADVAVAYGVTPGPVHRADADAATAAQVLIAQLWQGVNADAWSRLADLADTVAATRKKRSSRDVAFEISLDVTDEEWEQWRAEDQARVDARDPLQTSLWARYEEMRYANWPVVSTTLPGLLDEARKAWPPGDQNLLEIAGLWAIDCSEAFERTRSDKSRRKLAPMVCAAYEEEFAQQQAAGLCRTAVHTYRWEDVLAALPTKDGIVAFRRWFPILRGWPECATCYRCASNKESEAAGFYRHPFGLAHLARALPPHEVTTAQAAKTVDTHLNAWFDAFTDGHDTEALSTLTLGRIVLLEEAKLDEDAVAAGMAGIAAGCRIYDVANRLGIILERKIGDKARALKLSTDALTWPAPRGSTDARTREAIRNASQGSADSARSCRRTGAASAPRRGQRTKVCPRALRPPLLLIGGVGQPRRPAD
jgi:DNA polymerase III epsilon subunit-like protein